jgi:hypothetical protein
MGADKAVGGAAVLPGPAAVLGERDERECHKHSLGRVQYALLRLCIHTLYPANTH